MLQAPRGSISLLLELPELQYSQVCEHVHTHEPCVVPGPVGHVVRMDLLQVVLKYRLPWRTLYTVCLSKLHCISVKAIAIQVLGATSGRGSGNCEGPEKRPH